jgi:hypothetical protein
MNSQAESLRAKLALEVSSMGHSSTSCARASAFAQAHTLWRNTGLLSQGAFEVRSRATELVKCVPFDLSIQNRRSWSA